MAEPPPEPPPEIEAPTPERDRMPRWLPRAIVLFWVVFAAVGFVEWMLGRLHTLLVLLLVSLFFALAIEPAVNSLARRGWRRGAATATVMLGLLLASLVFVTAIGTLLVNQVADFIDNLPDYVQSTETWVNNTFDTKIDADQIIADLTKEGGPVRRLAANLAGNSVRLGTTALGFLLESLSIFLFTFYMVADGPRLRRTVCSVLKPDVQREVLRAWEVAIDKTGGYLYSRALLALASTLFHWVAFTVIGVPYPLALAIWVGIVSQFVPVIGTYIAGVLPVVVGLVDRPVVGLWVLAVIVVYQQIENYLLAPRITARTMELHPAVAFGAVIAGAALLGPVGALLALPTAASAQAFASLYVHRHDVVDSHLTLHAPPARNRRSLRKRAEPAELGVAGAPPVIEPPDPT